MNQVQENIEYTMNHAADINGSKKSTESVTCFEGNSEIQTSIIDQVAQNMEFTINIDDNMNGNKNSTESESFLEGNIDANTENSSSTRRNPIEEIIDGKTYWTPNVDNEPYIGQKFATKEEGLAFYKEYAKNSGFEARIGSTKKIKGVEGYGRRCLVCNRQGEKKEAAYDTSNDPNKQKRKRPSIRQKCGAFVNMRVNEEKLWFIYKMDKKHNHTFVTEEDQHFLNSERRLTYLQKKIIHDMAHINMGPSTAYKYMKQSRGGFENTGVTETDTKNFKRDWNQFIGEGDADFVIEILNKKKEYLNDFSFEYSVGNNGQLTGLFWADEEAKRNYNAFGDVVGFDATYRTNK